MFKKSLLYLSLCAALPAWSANVLDNPGFETPGIPIADEETLRKELEVNVRERNAKAVPVKWRFTTQDARRKLTRMHPHVST